VRLAHRERDRDSAREYNNGEMTLFERRSRRENGQRARRAFEEFAIPKNLIAKITVCIVMYLYSAMHSSSF